MLCIINSASANDTRKNGLYTYEIKGNGTIVITDFDWENNDGSIYIPSMIDGYTLTGIGDNAFSIDLPEDKNERKAAKSKMESMAAIVVLPNSLTSIGKKAFFNAPVTSIDIPENVKYIGEGAFAGTLISRFSVAPNHDTFACINGALYEKKGKKLLAFPKVNEIPEPIPEGIIEIGAYAFYDLINVPSENLPQSISVIGDYAFSLAYFSFNKKGSLNVDRIGEYAFYGARISSGLRVHDGELIINAKSIGNYAFANPTGSGDSGFPQKTIIGSAVKEIGDFAFSSSPDSGFKWRIDFSFPHITKSIGTGAFSSIDSPTNIQKDEYTIRIPSIEDGEIKERTFFSSYQGRIYKYKIVISDGITKIGKRAFADCISVISVELPETIKEIAENAFSGCEKLKELLLPASIESIGDNAFDRSTITLVVTENSYAHFWAQENGYSYRLSDSLEEDTSWLYD